MTKTKKKTIKRSKEDKKTLNYIRNNLTKKTQYQERVAKQKGMTKTPDQLALLLNPEDTPENPLTYSRLMNWLAHTGWVHGYVRKRISPMDAILYEDYAQSVWLVILELNPELIMEVWYNGKGRFINFLKRVIDVQLYSTSTSTYLTNKRFHHIHCTLSDEQWLNFEEGNEDTTSTKTYPVKYECTSGNRKKMIKMEHDIETIHSDYNELTDNQIHPNL